MKIHGYTKVYSDRAIDASINANTSWLHNDKGQMVFKV